MKTAKIRLYVDHPLGQGQTVPLDRDQAHYLFGVMRQGAGDAVLLFNGTDGEWRATVAEAGKRGGLLRADERTRDQRDPPDLWLLFAPIKKARTDFIVEKAAEMGAARILPVQTDFTNSERIRQDRLQAHAIEAAEQCGGTFVPEVADAAPLARSLAAWEPARRILWADEGRVGPHDALPPTATPGPWAILIGPEGGFSDAERARLAAQ
ncbi:MAG: 16S rRNA (uracil(1498)-N(3))-methyltransferase [Roseovarius sp.]|nr:16S rRNA (uracil(1498)-N(3))-methyltransferase [Roseovarius sp.]